jgi:TATA-box binding protein (TBP) (component of TFIID and TFIIIB)
MKHLLNLYFVLFISVILNTHTASSQTTLILQPNAEEGKDAHVNSNFPNTNYQDNAGVYSAAWTWSGSHGDVRSFIQFDLSTIPEGATITSAELSLYNDPGNTLVMTSGAHSNLTSSNKSYISRLTSSWDESTVCWNNQPNFTIEDQIILEQSTEPNQDYTDMDVLDMVQYMVDYPEEDYGFVLRLQNEEHYAALIFASSDNEDTINRPKLVITYDDATPMDTCQNVTMYSSTGQDAHVNSNFPNTNYQNNAGVYSAAWTWSGSHGDVRSFIQFDLSSIPEGATVTNAELSLYNDLGNTLVMTSGAHSNLTASNKSYISRLTSSWDESTVCWNNQPSYTEEGQIVLEQSTSPHQDYTGMDVINMVQHMVDYPNEDFGFVLRLENEVHYAALIFASGENPDSNLHPKLEVCYNLNTGFEEKKIVDEIVKVYPNPSTGIVNIETQTKGFVEVYSLSGSLLIKDIIEEGTSTFDFGSFNKGVYIIKLITLNQVSEQKIIIR